MKKLFFLLMLLLWPPASLAGSSSHVPHQIAGISLGKQAAMYQGLLRMETAIPVRDQPFLTEVETGELPGYLSGSVIMGNCANPGVIVRIKLKYAFADLEFYEELLHRFKRKFGEPDEWRGDPFRIVRAWKWSFHDKQDNKITLLLQHSRDVEEKFGTSVKLTNSTLMEKERLCYSQKKAKPGRKQQKEVTIKRPRTDEEFQPYIPQ
ncbi:MAG: hypothetical protein JRJ12_12835 [Deltaproteobacteria bacterium]|nr:hypothetical protein [Deltaproteobacteria bacterium]MBW2072082.1 hypothetical protein [Deltaproteobacteria bacterium]